MGRAILSPVLSLLGAVGGAILGVLLFGWILQQGFYALAIPGAALGLGCLLASPDRSQIRGVMCGVVAVVLGYFVEWRYRPFLEPNEGLAYFAAHLPQLSVLTHVMIAVGAIVAFWWGRDASPWICRGKGKS